MLSIFGGFALFASAITTNKVILQWLSPAFFVGIRMLTAGLLLFIIRAWRSPRMRICYLKSDIFTILIISAFTTFIPSLLKAFGIKYMISSKAALIGSLDPFITAIYAYFLWNEKLSVKKLLGMIIGFSGILFLLTSTSPSEEIFQSFWIISLPELAVFCSMVISRYGWIMARNMLKNERYQPSELNSLIMITGGIYALIYANVLGVCDFCTIPTSINFFALFTYTVIIGNMIGYTIYAQFLKKYNLTLVSLAGLSVPLFVHLYGPFALGESISSHFFIALAIVFTGMYIFYQDEIKS